MRDRARRWLKPSLVVLLVCALVILTAVGVVFALLRHWDVAPAGAGGALERLRMFPEPRLQIAPQQDRDKKVAFEPPLGTSLPRGVTLRDEAGAPVDGSLVTHDGRATVLLPAYFRCDSLCGTVAQGALEALADTGLPLTQWRLVVFSFDPNDSVADARALRGRYESYAAWARPAVFTAEPPLHLLTGEARESGALAHAVGFSWEDETGRDAWKAHPAGLVVVTPEGRIARYLPGVRFAPDALREAIVDARAERIGVPTSFGERVLLACRHFDPIGSVRAAEAMTFVRGAVLLVVAGFALFVWHRSRAAR